MATQAVIKGAGSILPVRELKRNWGWLFALGVVSILAGIAAIALPWGATLAVSTFIGVIFIISGIAQAMHAFQVEGWGYVLGYIAIGVLYAIAGWAFVVDPQLAAATLTFMIGAMFFISGLIRIVMALMHRKTTDHWGVMVFNGLINLVLGFIIISGFPGTALWTIGLLVGVELLVSGATTLALATMMKRLNQAEA